MNFHILTLFPEMFKGPFSESLLQKAQEKKILLINLIDIRSFATDKHNKADDTTYGGGPGMVMKLEPILKAIENISHNHKNPRIIFMTPSGEKFTQEKAKELSMENNIVVLCGHYENIDQRILENIVTDEISMGDYVLTGGEIPAMALVDCVARLIPGVVKEEESVKNESFYDNLLDFPSYTKPEEYNGMKIPEMLKSGHHKKIREWRRKESLKSTFFRRPDLLAKANLTKEDRKILEEIIQNMGKEP
ncbi:tRNA (guanosine(37)-N1)-methyltransferase TrmD [candidate division WOR-1 bacterium RIFOXYD2_FULL_36_8]|uniref:tRNA (guanine-N(1)-)-methyltransferase n=1 Tax=candidate division WOR-1 bacterium RIFOXYB2_FULL_36_35 TaxID=1802578 RepID=A0A1F4S0P9_UNCSA|nr:MAG: tRNA (guanosine(37)-N1)-methyltransferase TrmD [candidate division WOR-1 bacterium RIFOXYA2_FULL_36_21]OGC13969.1 MAG: tRNA (guanosine(37)-N1)-methyltransferase TrmD [candidate division WOR-1 bacterium RIFOXYB2_FULL_36_35]OGC18796.1 MAG: tRNA (guanosine(37)-N1)-methyltransferase TrmD [candidate division WOR-1 bacterium RIFOXYA12_FULL_36_13]OGC41205.1 MAG: tRNA (guanosine(37)-N1)-methyltransferase TrmD [candidate division WOR-1 bacterium RIFOXYD2_FULL_36_8]